MLRVNVGCGASPTAGWVNLDSSPTVLLGALPLVPGALEKVGLLGLEQVRFARKAREGGVRYGVATRLPLADGAVEVLYSSHMFEHLSLPDAGRFLAEARRVLVPGGILRLVVPDLRRLARGYLESGDADRFMQATNLSAPPAQRLLSRVGRLLLGGHHHAWMYDAQSLCARVAAAGFSEVAAVPAGQTRIEAPGPLDLREREDESIYVEATRR
jgi:SAM-dependent methyltransferase